jgi:protein-S-isoprenylcysteine O-methyltransferase Ste14
MSLKSRMTVRMALLLLLTVAMVFGPAGSFRFWQGWVWIGVSIPIIVLYFVHLYRHDPELLKRRLKAREQRREQRIFQMIGAPLWLVTLLLPGFDYRFGWSARWGGVPALATGVAYVVVLASWGLIFEVMKTNTFAATIIQVEPGQKVITDGPYRVVRHPMYSGFALMIVAAPLTLGSYVSLAPAVLLVPLLVFRLLDEERLLRTDLAGYADYCERVRWRLAPWVF